MNITEMKDGEVGVISSMSGGFSFMQKLQNMGILIGKEVKKISGFPFNGPIVLEVNGATYTIGHGMAERIFV